MISRTAAALALAVLACAARGQDVPLPTVQRHHYVCDAGERVQTDVYLTAAGPSFVVLHYKGKAYGLAPAVVASGARYVGLVGTNFEVGLEWWSKGNEALLAEVNRQDVDDSLHLLTCKVAPRP